MSIEDPDGRRPTGDRVLEEAAALFRSRGYTAATTRELAERLGIQNSSLYHHIESKEDLLYQILKRSLDLITEAVVAAGQNASPERRLAAMVKEHAVASLRDRDLHATLLTELRALRPDLRDEIVQGRTRYERILCDAIAADQQAGRIRDDVEPGHVTLALLNLLNWTIFWFEPEGELSAEQLGDLLAEVFLHGARPRAS